jgi:hypothetical protein
MLLARAEVIEQVPGAELGFAGCWLTGASTAATHEIHNLAAKPHRPC